MRPLLLDFSANLKYVIQTLQTGDFCRFPFKYTVKKILLV